MKYKFIVQAQTECTEEELDGGIIGAKEHLAGILERLGFTVDHINVMPGDKEPAWKQRMLNTFLGGEGK